MRVEWEVGSQHVGLFLECLPQCHSRHALPAGIESVKEQYCLFFLHIGLQRYSKNGRKPPLQQLSVLFLTKIAQISHLNSFNSLYSQRSISSLEGNFNRWIIILLHHILAIIWQIHVQLCYVLVVKFMRFIYHNNLFIQRLFDFWFRLLGFAAFDGEFVQHPLPSILQAAPSSCGLGSSPTSLE